MYVEIYLDVVFAVNFILDFIILLLERRISRKKVSLNRIFIGALVGAVLMCIILLIPNMNYILYLAFSYFFSSALIILVTFRPKKVKELIKLTLLLYMIAILLGGIIFSLYYYSFVGSGLNRIFAGNLIKGLDLQMLLILLCLAVIIWVIFINIFFKVVNISKSIYDIGIFYHDQEMKINALLDTGNTLYDPITHWPVIIGEIGILRNYFTEVQFEALLNVANNIYDLAIIEENQQKLGIHFRWIPFTSIGNENGMMLGIALDKVVVNVGKELKEHKNVIIALYNKKLSNDNSYSVLLHPKLI
ncbi:MAG: sigma-E processing peptidase SpoIIGA [Vallitaleaceae bacterium]|nr:sigma-E processing peptidase SpoIIGA [Vallitaleaceae bacterium]